MAAKQVTLDDLINSLDPEIRVLLEENTREVLDKRPTIIDISYNSLLVNNKDNVEDFKVFHAMLLKVVGEKAARTYKSIEDIPRGYFQGSTPYLVYINGGSDKQFLIGKSVGPIRKFITDKISKDPRLVDSIFGLRKEETEILNKKGIPTGDVKTKFVTKVDIGHAAMGGELAPVAISPLAYKLFGLIEYGELTGSPVAQYAEDALNKLYALQADISYSFKNNAPQVIEAGEKTLGDLFVIVTLHTSELNQQFSDQEKKIFADVKRKIALVANKALRDKFLIQNIEGSNTIAQDIKQGLVSILKPGKSKLAKHIPHTGKSEKEQINVDKKVTSGKVTSKVAATGTKTQAPPSSPNLPQLLLLINSQLQDVVSANMGDGNSRNVLNYRTGRFASTVKVEQLTNSKQGMITAFYSYMKNPYATFSSGGRQSTPKSRDPKLLISKSIREIAQQVVSNNLRAVAL
jgi:hypothetical protein